MLTAEQNKLLTETGPGTPCGNLLRRYWQPVALAEELPLGAPPRPLKILGEELVLFRDEAGRPGLLELHCAHRGADLSYGRIEDGGLRCIYHGWLFDICGNCLDQPGEPEGSDFHKKVKQPAYPVREHGGVIFAYMGPGEAPLFPNYDFLHAPEDQRAVTKILQECNYLQGNEGNMDPVHNNLLHHPVHISSDALEAHRNFAGGRGPVPGKQRIEYATTRFGIELCDITDLGRETKNLRTYNFVMPNLVMFPGPLQGVRGYMVNWHVPIDDFTHWKFIFGYSSAGPLDKEWFRRAHGPVDEQYHLLQNKRNRYLQDRSRLNVSYSGIDGIPVQDTCAIEGMGPIQDRTKEHLGASDRVIIMMRRMLLKAIEDVEKGFDPPHVIRKSEENWFPDLVVWSGVVAKSADWQEVRREIEARHRERSGEAQPP